MKWFNLKEMQVIHINNNNAIAIYESEQKTNVMIVQYGFGMCSYLSILDDYSIQQK